MLSTVDYLSDEMLNGIDVMYDSIKEIVATLSDDATTHVTTLAQPSQSRGCPKLKLCRDQLRFLLDAKFTQNDTTSFLKCSSKTVSRRMKEYNLTIQITQITEHDLDQVTLLYVKRFTNAGQKSYCAFLLGQGIHISRQKAQDSLLRVDPEGVMQRFKNTEDIVYQGLTVFGILMDTINLLGG